MKLIIAGSRTFEDPLLMRMKIRTFLSEANSGFPPDEVISGTARGADSLGEEWAKEVDVKVTRYPAQWDRYGKSAGYRRNELMALLATHAIVFWDGESRGAKHMILMAKKENLGLKVVKYNV